MDIYFDTMVISRLRNGSKYIDINNYIINNRDINTFFYSKAHIFDLMNDKTNEKYLDLEYIEKYFGNNYLLKSFNQPTKIYQIQPLEAYKEEIMDDNDPLNNLDNIFDESILKPYNALLDFPIDIPNKYKIDFNSEDLPYFFKIYLNNLFKSTSLRELINVQNEFQKNMNENKEIYRYIRKVTKNNQNIVLIDNYKNYNLFEDKIFINNDIKMTFIEYIDSCITINLDNEEEKYYHRFCTGYNILNSIGIDSEKNKKSNFKNTFNDGLHAFYASYCELFVTSDLGIIEKSQIMYKLFNIKTKVINPECFIKFMGKKD